MTRIILAALPAVATLAAALLFLASPVLSAECGIASWYGGWHHGRTTASGERFDQHGLTAAHRTLPFGVRLRVSWQGRTVTVRINDRGPYVRGRSLDLSRGAAERLGMIDAGIAQMCWERVP